MTVRNRSLPCLIALVMTAVVSTALLAQQGSGRSVFRSSVDLVALNVTLTDSQQRHVGDMAETDFAVFEDGVQQEVSFFAVGQIPLDLAILLDTSSSMSQMLDTAQAAAIGFVETAQPGDRVSVLEISTRANVLHPLNDDLAQAIAAIRRTSARGSTALYNAIYLAMNEMARSRRDATDVRRQAIAVLSDGQDTSSLVQYDDVLELARESGVTLYTIALLSSYETHPLVLSRSKSFSQPQYVMRSLAQETGGRTFLAHDVRELDGIYTTIANELAQQYTLGYISKNPKRDGAYRRIVVRLVDRPDIAVRTRTGYLAPRPRPGSVRMAD